MLHGGNIFFQPMSIVHIGQTMMSKDHRFRKSHMQPDTCRAAPAPANRNNRYSRPAATSDAGRSSRCESTAATRLYSSLRRGGLLCLLLVSQCAGMATAQRIDSFESGELRWQLVDSDCQAELVTHELSQIMPHGGSSSELLELSCKAGTMALLAYPIEPCRILNEFQPALWVRSSSGRIQLGVRVLFPQAEHPVTGGRLSTILWGDIYSETGQWQMLQVTDLEKKLAEEIIGLRQQFDSSLALDNPIIDSLVVNGYTGPGRCRLQLDDLNLRGLISLAATGQPPPPNWRQQWRWRPEPSMTAEQRYWQQSNRPVTWLHYHQESLPWLKSLGFSGLILEQVPSQRQLASISSAGLGAIVPPPPHNLAFDAAAAPAIEGWFIGAALDARQADTARAAAMRVAQMPSELQRPLVAEALEQYWLFSRIADQVVLPFPASTTAGTTREKMTWAEQNLETTKKRGQGWVSIWVGPNPALVDQIRSAQRVIEPDSEFDGAQANPLGLRHQVACAVVSGARGFAFRTFQPLEISGTGQGATLASLRWIHDDLAMWGPWIMGGQATTPPTLSRSDFSTAAWSVSQSRLVLAIASSPAAQHCVPSTYAQPLNFSLPSPSTPQQVLRLGGGRLQRMDVEQTPAGLTWSVEQPEPIESFIVTSNPLVIEFARKQISNQAEQRAADQLEVASYNLSLASKVVQARYPVINGDPARAAAGEDLRRLGLARRHIEQGYQALHARQPTAATALALRGSDRVQAVLSEAFEVATSNLATPQSSPLVVSPVSLGYHWQLAAACERSEWRDLPIPGSEFLAPQQMESLGWSLEQRPLEQADLQVEFLPPQAERSAGLRLAAYATPDVARTLAASSPPLAGGYEGASSRVRSSPAQVRAGELVRVAGRARILQSPASPDSGILIYDNQAGPSLGQLVRGKAGDVVPVELYRFIVDDGEFRILVECRGQCDIVLESISTSVIAPAVNRRSFVTNPNAIH